MKLMPYCVMLVASWSQMVAAWLGSKVSGRWDPDCVFLFELKYPLIIMGQSLDTMEQINMMGSE
jgi:hypothetical protein